MAKIVARAWRFSYAEPSGTQVWFDPTRERVEIHLLEPHSESGVASVLEGDEPTEIGRPDSSNNELVQDELPF